MLEVSLEQPVPREYQPDLLKNLYWVDAAIQGFEFDPNDGRRLRCRYAGAVPAGLGERVRNSAEKLARSLRALPAKVAFELSHDVIGCAAPYEELVARGWIKPALSGTHLYAGLFNELFHALDLQFRREALLLDAEEHKFPALISLKTLRTSGYLASFPHNANFVCHLPEHAEAVEEFKARFGASEGGTTHVPEHCCAPADAAMSPTVCYHFYQSHAGQTLAEDALLKATALSPCYRHEGRAMRGLLRLREFNMREIIFLGSASAIQSRRSTLLEVQRRMLERSHLRSVVRTASDPFFLDEYDKKRMFQLSFDLKQEVQAWLPADEEWLAIGSVNYHQDHFGRAFEISLSTGEPAHSCCLGFGIDRWCMAVFAQHGLECGQWPDSLREILHEHREATRLLRHGQAQNG